MPSKILIVEDDTDIQHYYELILSDMGLELLRAHSGQEALEIIDQGETISLILLDILMPGMSGTELFRILRQERRSTVPIIPCSVDEELAKRLRSIGPIQGLFVKGSPGDELRAMVGDLFG